MAATAQPTPREVMDIRQASDYLGISGDTLYRYASEGFIPAFKLGNRWRFKKSLLDSWMDEKSGVAPPPPPTSPKQKKPAGRARSPWRWLLTAGVNRSCTLPVLPVSKSYDEHSPLLLGRIRSAAPRVSR